MLKIKYVESDNINIQNFKFHTKMIDDLNTIFSKSLERKQVLILPTCCYI